MGSKTVFRRSGGLSFGGTGKRTNKTNEIENGAARAAPSRPGSSPRWPEPRIGPGWLPSPIAAILLFGDKNLFPRVITPGESCRLAAPETETALWRLFRYRRA